MKQNFARKSAQALTCLTMPLLLGNCTSAELKVPPLSPANSITELGDKEFNALLDDTQFQEKVREVLTTGVPGSGKSGRISYKLSPGPEGQNALLAIGDSQPELSISVQEDGRLRFSTNLPARL